MLKTPEQRRAYFARLQETQRRHFPVRGSTSRAQGNRILAIGVGTGIGTLGLMAATKGGSKGPLAALLGVTGERAKGNMEGRILTPQSSQHPAGSHSDFVYGRPATRKLEKLIARITPAPAAGERPHWLRRLFKLEVEQAPQAGSRWRGARPALLVRGVPLDAEYGLHGKPGKWLAKKIEDASIWNIFGKGELHGLIEDSSLRGQAAARNVTKKWLTRIAERLEAPVRRRLGRAGALLGKGNVALANKIRRGGAWLIVQAAKRGVR